MALRHHAVSAIGRDRPGIVADLAAVLLDLGANVEDVATSVLRGHFAIMLLASAPAEVDRHTLEGALQPLRGADLEIATWEVDAGIEATDATHVLAVYGPDHTGIVHAVARALARLRVNIQDMVCRLHDGDPPLYVLTVEVAVPGGVEPDGVRDEVVAAVSGMGLQATLSPVDRTDL
ncbi:MAG TPA: ACT domain-containing protein [Candidatus Dormibacteraeota bacterium]|jgi:glycine cleavage system transcriptional repressor|nr:ACT domain-containing protein [Candidatus Dormibacteraeota bacterium]